MSKAARRYDVYLPLSDNNGRPFADNLFRHVQQRLLERFGGLTVQQHEFPLQGIWQGGSRIYLDLVIIMTVLDFRRQGSTRFIAGLKQDLLEAFEQGRATARDCRATPECPTLRKRRSIAGAIRHASMPRVNFHHPGCREAA